MKDGMNSIDVWIDSNVASHLYDIYFHIHWLKVFFLSSKKVGYPWYDFNITVAFKDCGECYRD